MYSCKFVHLFILEFLVHVPLALSYTHMIPFVGRFKCIGRMSCACFKLHRSRSCNCKYDWIYNVSLQTMDELSAPRYIMHMIASSWWTTNSNIVMCTLHDFLCSKVRFIHTSTVTGSHSCSGKKLRVRIAYILS